MTSFNFRTKVNPCHHIVACDGPELPGPPNAQYSCANFAASDGAKQRAPGVAFSIFYYSYTLFQFAVGPVSGSVQFAMVLCHCRTCMVSGVGADGSSYGLYQFTRLPISAWRARVCQLAGRFANPGAYASACGADVGLRDIRQWRRPGCPDRAGSDLCTARSLRMEVSFFLSGLARLSLGSHLAVPYAQSGTLPSVGW